MIPEEDRQAHNAEDEELFRRQALRDALMCLAAIKLCSVTCYMVMYFLVLINTPAGSTWGSVLLVLIVMIIFLQIVLAALLLAGALKEARKILIPAIVVAVVLGVYDLILGMIGAVYFIRNGQTFSQFFLAAGFVCLALSYFPVFGNDVYLIYTYRKVLKSTAPNSPPVNRAVEAT